MVKVRNLKEVKVIPTEDPIRVRVNNNPHHVAHVKGYNIYSISILNYTQVSPGYTLDDLKQLRKEIRKVIRNESNKQL